MKNPISSVKKVTEWLNNLVLSICKDKMQMFNCGEQCLAMLKHTVGATIIRTSRVFSGKQVMQI